jgi:hypothetical protein
VFL